MTRCLRLSMLGVVLVAALAGGGATEGAGAKPRSLYLVPLGRVPHSGLEEIQQYAERKFGLRSALRPALPLPAGSFEPGRRQYVAERLIRFVKGKEPTGGALVVAFTSEDIFSSRHSELHFVFTNRADGGYAVISTKRMNPTFFGLPRDRDLVRRRLQKVVTRDLGFLTGRQPSSNWRSALYARLNSLDDLDGMTDELAPRITAGEASWVRGANRVCVSAKRGTDAVARRTRPAPSAPVREQRRAFLRFLSQAIPIEARAHASLRGLRHPVRRGSLNLAMLALFGSEVRLDQRNLRRLSRKWSTPLVQRWLRESVIFGLQLKVFGLELGSRGCARYFVPR